MWIYVICKTCGRNVARAVALMEIAPAVPIVMEDGGVACEIFEAQCKTCSLSATPPPQLQPMRDSSMA